MREKNALQDKPIIFKPLKVEMTVTEFMKKGYQREEIEDFFIELEVEGYGQYIIGSRGKGNHSRFIGNDRLPIEYLMVFKSASPRKEYVGKPEGLAMATIKTSLTNVPVKVVAEYDEENDKIVYSPQAKEEPLSNGYRVLMYQDHAEIGTRTPQKCKVFDTIKKAVDHVWEAPYYLRDLVADQTLKLADVVAMLEEDKSVPLVLWKDRAGQKAVDNPEKM